MPNDEPTAAAQQSQALADVERIAEAMYRAERRAATSRSLPWNLVPSETRSRWTFIAHRLLSEDVIRVGRRPETPRPLRGQLEIEERPEPPRTLGYEDL